MRRARSQVLMACVMFVVVAPIVAAASMEWLNIPRWRYRTQCHFPDVDLRIVQTEGGYAFVERDVWSGDMIGEVRFNAMRTYAPDRGFFFPSYTVERRTLEILHFSRGPLNQFDDQYDAIRKALLAHLQATNASPELLAEASMPNVHLQRMNWLGIYGNGLFATMLLCGVGLLVGWPAWGMTPRAIAQRRRAAGLCPKCKYDLRGTGVGMCPECGWGRPKSPDNP